MSSRIKSLIAAYSILFLDSFGFALIFPLSPILILNPQFSLHIPDTMQHFYLGLILAVFPFAQFFAAPFFGDLADRFGRRKILSWTLVGSIAGYLLSGLAILLSSYTALLLSRLLTGFFSANLAICMAIISDMNFGKRKRAKNLSYVAAFLGLSWMLAILIGYFLIDPKTLQLLHPSFLFWVAATLALIGLILLVTLYRETVLLQDNSHVDVLKGLHRIIHVLEHKQLRVLYFTLFFWFLGFYMTLQWATPLAIEKFHASPLKIMWFLILLGIFWTSASGFFTPFLTNHLSLWKMVLWTLFCLGLLYFFGAVANFFLYFGSIYVLSGIFASAAWSNNISLISLTSPSETQGKSFGIVQSVLSSAQLLGLFFGGILAGFSLEILFFVCSFFVLISFLLLLAYVVRRKNKLLKHI